MDVGDGGRFLENYTLEFAEITYACYYHPYVSPPEISWQIDAWFSIYDKKNFCSMYFRFM